MIKKLKLSTFEGALRVGGLMGWFFTVMYICELSLHFYQDSSLLFTVNNTFLLFCGLTLFVLVIPLSLLDIEGILSNKLLRWLPGLFMAESGIALSLANFATMTVFSAVAGVAFAFGAVAVLSCLLRVKVGQRLFSIALGTCLGAAIRLLFTFILSFTDRSFLLVAAICVGALAALTVHSDGYTSKGAPLVSRAEAHFGTIIKNIPLGYISLFICVAAYFFSMNHIEASVADNLPYSYNIYEYVTYGAVAVAALVISVLFKFQQLPMIFSYGTALSAAAAFLAILPNITYTETSIFAVLLFAGYACFRICMLLYIVIFSLDKPHPLFYAVFGYGIIAFAELCGSALNSRYALSETTYPIILLILVPIGAWFISYSMKRAGFTDKVLERRRLMKAQVRRKCEELEMTEREEEMIAGIVLDKFDIDDLSQRMLFSRNTVKVLLREPFAKLKKRDENEIRAYFEECADKVELKNEKERERIAAERKAAREEERRLKAEESDRRDEEMRKKFAERRSIAEQDADSDEQTVETAPEDIDSTIEIGGEPAEVFDDVPDTDIEPAEEAALEEARDDEPEDSAGEDIDEEEVEEEDESEALYTAFEIPDVDDEDDEEKDEDEDDIPESGEDEETAEVGESSDDDVSDGDEDTSESDYDGEDEDVDEDEDDDEDYIKIPDVADDDE